MESIVPDSLRSNAKIPVDFSHTFSHSSAPILAPEPSNQLTTTGDRNLRLVEISYGSNSK